MTTTRILAHLALFVTLALPASAQPVHETPHLPAWSYGVLVAGQAADVLTTTIALHSPRFAEGNPLGLRGVLISKAVYVTVIALVMHHYQAEPKFKWMGVGVGLAGAVPAMWNVRQMTSGGAR